MNAPGALGDIAEFNLDWKSSEASTHELAISRDFIFVTGQKMHQIAKFDYSGNLLQHYDMPGKTPENPAGSGPHGILIDQNDRLWVSLEFAGLVVRLDEVGNIAESIDVRMHPGGASEPINTAPHGICLDADGETIWFTGKRTSTVGKINPDKTVEHFQLDNLAALPIFLHAGPDGAIWGTELLASSILNVNGEGRVKEYPVPTANSRPIGIIPDPEGGYMWFTEEAGNKIGRIDMNGKITEYPVPALQKNDILASLAFDREMNLWVQVYVDMHNPEPAGYDYIIKIDKSIRTLAGNDLSGVPFCIQTLPSKMSMMHRIKMDYEGNLWFTEMMTDKLGKVTVKVR
jgi:virginiamycin B lyase